MAKVSSMVSISKANQLRQQVNSEFNEYDQPQTEGKQGVVFFLSFDIVNSTEFKIRAPRNWQILFKEFFQSAIELTESTITNARVWKKAGDEVLFYFQILSRELLPGTISKISYIQDELRRLIKTHAGPMVLLDVKATFWCAFVGDNGPYNLLIQEGHGSLDFIGPDIDFGFRLSSEGAPGILVVDPKIVWILQRRAANLPLESNQIFRQTVLVSYKILKGVWNGRYVPIFWHHSNISSPRDILPYDEHKRNPIAFDLIENKQLSIDLNKIGHDLGVIGQWVEINDKFDENIEPIFEFHPEKKEAEVHIVAVCINENHQVLCAKRAINKTLHPGLWELGCSHFQFGSKNIYEILRDEYSKTFSVEILNLLGGADEPTPVSTFGFRESTTNNHWIPGIVFVAKARNTSPIHNPSKHSHVRWMTLEEISSIKVSDAIPGFHKRVKLAFCEFNKQEKSVKK
jgi:isopentenyldiphosphate isomerase